MNTDIQQLTQRRLKWVEATRENNFEEGIKRLLTELYPDNAHFIYELLQNAEDTGATKVRFILCAEGVDFEHNGNRLFSLSDVDSITSIAVSTKREDPTSIGKFGVGFKAVFAYTITPEIHSGKFHFRIHDLVIPETNGVEQPLMGERETRFIFRFDHPKKSPAQAVQEVKSGLRALGDNTLLFLSHIYKIEYLLPDGSLGSLERIDHEGGYIEIHASHPGGNDSVSHWLRFQKDVEVIDEDGEPNTCRIAIAYKLVEEEDKKNPRSTWKIVPLDHGQVSIYFPAEKETSNLRFHLHAPFASTVARDSVRDCKANNHLRDHLANLVVESFAAVRDQGMMNVGFLAVLPIPDDNLPTFYEPIRKAIVQAFQNEPLTPTRSGVHARKGELYRGPAKIADVLNDDDLSLLIKQGPPLWTANPPLQNQREDRFLKSLVITDWGWIELVKKINRLDEEERKRVENWIAQKDDAWLMRFYALLGEACGMHHQRVDVSGLRMVRVETDHGTEHVISKKAFFRPDGETTLSSGISFVKATVYSTGRSEDQKKFAKSFLEGIGVRPFDEKAVIELKLAYYKTPPVPVEDGHYRDLEQFISFWKKNPNEIGLFSDHTFLLGVSQDNKQCWENPAQLCLDTPYLETGLTGLAMIHGKDMVWDGYHKKLSPSQLDDFKDFLKAVGVLHQLVVSECSTFNNPKSKELRQDRRHTRRSDSGIDHDYSIQDLDKYLSANSVVASRLIWDALICAGAECAKASFRPNQQYPTREAVSQLIHQLRGHAWIPDKSGEFRKPCDMTKDDLHTDFPYNDRNGLLTAIGFSENARKRGEDYYALNQDAQKMGFASADEADKMAKFAKLLKENGKSPDEIISQFKVNIKKEKPAFPTRAVSNPERRQERVSEQLNDATEKEYEERDRSVRTSRGTIDPDVWLRNQYTNVDNQMVCQICKEEMPFRKRNGEYYFEKVEALSKDFTKEHEAQFLALCPLCAAMYKEFVKCNKDAMIKFKKDLMISEETEVPLDLGERKTSVRFVKPHLDDIKTILGDKNEVAR